MEQHCYFSEINTIRKGPLSRYYASDPWNTSFEVKENCIQFITRGGNQISSPFDNVTSVFPLQEGLIIGKDEQYEVLLSHPLSMPIPLLDFSEEILFTSRQLPIIVAYNSNFMRHSVHIIRGITENGINHITTELYFEEQAKEERARTVLMIQGNQEGSILICLLSSTNLRVFDMNFYDQNEEEANRNVFNTLKLVQVISNVTSIAYTELFQHQKLLAGSQSTSTYKILNQNDIPQSLLLSHTGGTFTVLFGSKIIITYSPTLSVTDPSLQVNDPILQSILNALKLLEPQQYMCLLKDVIANCASNQHIQTNQEPHLTEFQRFTYLIVFYLKLCGNKPEEEIVKKVKVQATPTKDTKEKSASFQKLLQSKQGRIREGRYISFTYHMTLEMFTEVQEKLLYIMHLLYYDISLDNQLEADKLLYLLYCFAVNFDSDIAQYYVEHYLRLDITLKDRYLQDSNIQLLPTIKCLQKLGEHQQTKLLPTNPIDPIRWFDGLLNKQFSRLPILFKKTKQLCQVLQAFYNQQLLYLSPILRTKKCDKNPELYYQRIFDESARRNYFQEKATKAKMMDELKGAALVVYLASVKKLNVNKLPLHFRVPLLEIFNKVRNNFPQALLGQISKETFHLLDRMDIYQNCKLYFRSKETSQFKKYVNSILSGFKDNDQDVEFAYDKHQLIQVKRMFDYQRDIRVKYKMTEHIPEERLDQDAPAVLQKLLYRKLSLFIGLGLLMYGTSDHFITDQIKFPQLNLSGVLQQNSLKLTIDSTREEYPALTQWPEFHLGAIIALQLSHKLRGLSQESLRTWILYQKPAAPSNIHGGFMLGLGMLGYLSSFNQIDLYQLLTQNHEGISVGVLLGIGASRIGSCDEATQKSLTIHIPSLIPPVYDLDLPSNVSTAALCSLGFLFQGSGNRNFTEVALGLIGRKPINDKVTDREGYSLAAGIALGLINLGKGSVWRRELQIEERLVRFVQGGKILPPPQSSLSTNFVSSENFISSIREGTTINIHITCPAALMALTLLFLQTNSSIVEQLAIPQSFSQLEACNPNHIILKSMAKNLIQWDKIPTTREALYNQIPELIRYLFEQPLKSIHQKYYIVYNIEVIDFMSVSMIYTGIVAGALLAIGIKFAGTHDERLKTMMLQEFEIMMKLKISHNEFANDADNKCAVEQYTYYTNIVNVLQALSLLMAGSFDAQVLAAAKAIRQKMETSQIWHFGFHQAINMAIGFLHMAKGAYSFQQTQRSIAMLFISVYPYYPTLPADNKQYLQALRWSWVLSLQPKIFRIIDIAGKVCFPDVQIQQKEKQINEIAVQDYKYLPLVMKFTNQQISTVYVQSKLLTRIDESLLQDGIHSLKTMMLLKDHRLQTKLKKLIEWKYIKHYDDQQLQILADDNTLFIELITELKQTKQYTHIPIMNSYYRNNPGVLKPIEVPIAQVNDLKGLVLNNVPMITKNMKEIAKQIPPQILEFYLYRSFPSTSQQQLKLIAQWLQQ